jgi:hypothetical protein
MNLVVTLRFSRFSLCGLGAPLRQAPERGGRPGATPVGVERSSAGREGPRQRSHLVVAGSDESGRPAFVRLSKQIAAVRDPRFKWVQGALSSPVYCTTHVPDSFDFTRF